eukprot:1156777-Pelagomonas_calceolata.AAC.8
MEGRCSYARTLFAQTLQHCSPTPAPYALHHVRSYTVGMLPHNLDDTASQTSTALTQQAAATCARGQHAHPQQSDTTTCHHASTVLTLWPSSTLKTSRVRPCAPCSCQHCTYWSFSRGHKT